MRFDERRIRDIFSCGEALPHLGNQLVEPPLPQLVVIGLFTHRNLPAGFREGKGRWSVANT